MREATGDIWAMVGSREAVVITINGDINSQGRLVMGKGIALEAKQRVKGLDRVLGDSVATHGLHTILLSPACYMPRWDLYAMPVKRHWRETADPDLIVKSAREMVALVEKEIRMTRTYQERHADYPGIYPNIWLPRPGCGAGGLRWEDVKPLLDPILDDRYVAVTR